MDETSLGGAGAAFPSTRWSRINRAADRASPERGAALDELCRLYWKPVYAYLRSLRHLSNEEAKDMTQEFLIETIEGGLLERAPRERNFRPYLRGALKLFLLERRREASAKKRGGGRVLVSLDDGETALVEQATVRPDRSPEDAFDRAWANAVLDQAVADLRRELVAAGREVVFRVFERYELNPPAEAPTYGAVAREFGVKETDVTNWLSSCKKRLKELVLERIRETLDGEDPMAEMMSLFSK
jgi:RNA polymerase sigma-70 factor (ECF subfamily)